MGFLLKIEGDIRIKEISFVKFHPRASLARSAFTLKLSLIPAIDLLPPSSSRWVLPWTLRKEKRKKKKAKKKNKRS